MSDETPKKTSIGEKILKRKKDAALQKQLASEQIDYEANEKEDEITKIVQESDLQRKSAEQRKKKFWLILGFIIAPILIYGIYLLFKPYESDMRFGFCRVFLELNVQYPDKLQLSQVEEKTKFVRIWYIQTDSFGQDRMENIECYHGADQFGNYFIERIRIDRRDVDPARVTRFNTSLSTIMAHPPSLVYPRRLRDALGNMRKNHEIS